jgi:hypothetical protein
VGVPRGTGAVMGLGPDRVPAGHDPDVARAGGASLFGQWRASADEWAPMAVRVGRERRGARGTSARVGRPEKKRGCRGQMNSNVWHLFKLIQTS